MTIENSALPTLDRISDYVSHYGDTQPEVEAVIHGSTRLTWHELAQQVDQCARAFLALGIGKGDRVCVLSTPRPEFWITFLAAARIGAIWTGLNPRYTRREMAHVLGDATPKVLMSLRHDGARDFSKDISELAVEFAIPRAVWFGTPEDTFETFLALGNAVPEQMLADATAAVGPDDPCLIVYTSGSSGSPKGAVIPHRGPCFCSRLQNCGWGARTDRTRIINFFPINHLACVVDISCLALASGGTLVFMEQFDPQASLATIEAEKITVLGGVPTMLQFIFGRDDLDAYDLTSLETIAVGGAAAPEALVRLMQAYAPLVSTGYGSTETVGQMTFSPPGATLEQIAGSIGLPVPEYDLRIADGNGVPVAPGDSGEIQVRGRFLFQEYLNQPDATAESFTQDGWFCTGDIVVERPDGYWKMVGRLSDMYKSGGYNIYPREIEACLEAHPLIEIAAVIGVPNATYQEVGHAFFQVKQGAAGDTLTADVLRDHCGTLLANYKIPKAFTILPELPMLPVGKVDKMALKRIANQPD